VAAAAANVIKFALLVEVQIGVATQDPAVTVQVA
jgi:hypothetical protein